MTTTQPNRVRREPPTFRQVEVGRTTRLTPHLVRITLTGAQLDGFRVDEPAASVRLLLPSSPDAPLVMPAWNGNEFLLPDGRRPLLRTYTPRHVDSTALELDVDIVLHPGGAAAAWAGGVSAGRPVAVSGPGRGYTIDPDARSMLLAGDETAVPAIAQLLEVIPSTTQVQVVVEARPGAQLPLPAHPGASVAWVEPTPGAPIGAAMADAIVAADLDADAVVWAAGEAAAVQRIRRHLFEDRGFSRSQATVRGYWKHGRAGGGDGL